MLFQLFSVSLGVRRAAHLVVPAGTSMRASGDQDHSGRGVSKPVEIPVHVDNETGVMLPDFPGALAHSFWRAQELTLLRRECDAVQAAAVLDFGCGDGSFASLVVKEGSRIAYGVDIDPVALEVAAGYGIYDRLVTFERMGDLEAGSVDFAFSCSVLEHTTDLPGCLAAIARVLRPGGRFAFTVPSPAFTSHMAELVDSDFAESCNEKMYHRNLLSAEAWQALLTAAGFEVVEQKSFQPISVTRTYFGLTVLNERQLGRLPFVSQVASRQMRRRLCNEIASSIGEHSSDGANHFFVARRISRNTEH